MTSEQEKEMNKGEEQKKGEGRMVWTYRRDGVASPDYLAVGSVGKAWATAALASWMDAADKHAKIWLSSAAD